MDETRCLWLLHSSLCLRSPVVFDLGQARLAIGITCPRHRRILKARLGILGRLIPDREWVLTDGPNGRDEVLVSIGGLWGRRR